MKHLFLLLFGAVTVVAHAQVPDYVPTEGLVGWYPLNGDLTNEVNLDESNLLIGGNFVTGQANDEEGALSFTEDSWAEIPLSIGTTEALTVTLWIKEGINPPNGLQTALYLGQEGFLGDTTSSLDITRDRVNFPGDGRLRSNLNYDFGHVGFEELDGGWVHVVSVFDSGVLSIYRNGLLQQSTAASVSGISITGISTLGAGHVGTDPEPFNFCHCALDNIGLWNRALSEEEVTALYNAAAPATVSGCTDSTACNYDAEATSDDGSCIPSGCMEPLACNYNALAECAGEACDYTCCPGPGCCADGTSWDFGLGQCVASSSNSDPAACGPGTYWDELESLCLPIETCENDLDGDGVIGVNDLMQLLSSFGTDCPDSWTCGDPVTYHGYDYATVQIGEQCWFAENLQSEKFRNDDDIAFHATNEEWMTGDPARCAPDSNLALVLDYGLLYNGYAVNDERALCPANWHVSSDADWIELEALVGIEDSLLYTTGIRCNTGLCALALKSGPEDAPSWTGTNETGFSAIPSGQRQFADYNWHQVVSTFWCEESGPFVNFHREMHSFISGGIYRGSSNWYDGRSVRCVHD